MPVVKSFDNCKEAPVCLEEINRRRREKKVTEVDRIDCAARSCPGWSLSWKEP